MTDELELDRARRLMMGALDDELAPGEREELDRLLASDAELAREWERLRRTREVTESMRMRQPPIEVWDGYWDGIYNRIERGLGWILVSAGAIVLLGWGTWRVVEALLADLSVPVPIKLAVLAVALGAVVLFVSVVRERWLLRDKDPYRSVLR